MAGTKMLTVSLILKAVNEATGPLREVGGAIQTLDKIAERTEGLRALGDNLKSMGKEAMIAGGLITASLAAPIAAFKNFEDAETRARLAYMTGAGIDPLFPKIARQAKELGDALPGTTRDFEQMAGTLRELGESSKTILGGGLQATAYLRVLLPDLAPTQAADMMVGFERGLNVIPEDFVRFVDYAQRAKFGFGLNLVEFADTVKYVGPLLGVIGVRGLEGAKDIMVLAGAMSRAGIAGSMMGTSLRETLGRIPQIDRILKSNKDVASILGRNGIQLKFFDEKGAFISMENMIKQVEKLGVLSQRERLFVLDQLFGERAATAMAQTAVLGTSGFRAARGELDKQATLMERVKEVLGTLSSKWEAATGTIVNALAAIGRAIGPDIKLFADAVNAAAGWLSDFAENHQTMLRVALYAIGVVGALVAVFGAFVFALGSAMVAQAVWAPGLASLSIALRLVGIWTAGAAGAVRAFSVALLSSPVGILVSLATLAYLVYRNWDTVRGVFADLWAWLRGFGGEMFDAGANLVNMLWQGIKSVASKPVELFRSIVQGIRDHLPFSPAKVGPLRDLHRVRLVQTVADTITSGPMMRAMRAATAAAVSIPIATSTAAANIPLGASSSTAPVIQLTYSPQITLSAGAPADVRALLEQMQRDHADELRRVVESAMRDYERTLFRSRD